MVTGSALIHSDDNENIPGLVDVEHSAPLALRARPVIQRSPPGKDVLGDTRPAWPTWLGLPPLGHLTKRLGV